MPVIYIYPYIQDVWHACFAGAKTGAQKRPGQ